MPTGIFSTHKSSILRLKVNFMQAMKGVLKFSARLALMFLGSSFYVRSNDP